MLNTQSIFSKSIEALESSEILKDMSLDFR